MQIRCRDDTREHAPGKSAAERHKEGSGLPISLLFFSIFSCLRALQSEVPLTVTLNQGQQQRKGRSELKLTDLLQEFCLTDNIKYHNNGIINYLKQSRQLSIMNFSVTMPLFNKGVIIARLYQNTCTLSSVHTTQRQKLHY